MTFHKMSATVMTDSAAMAHIAGPPNWMNVKKSVSAVAPCGQIVNEMQGRDPPALWTLAIRKAPCFQPRRDVRAAGGDMPQPAPA